MNKGSAPNDVIYTYSEAELRAVLVDIEKSGKSYQQPIQRYKGLGEMDAEQLEETTMSPAKRMLRRVKMSDAEQATQIFELLMGNEVGPRREFIQEGPGLERVRIDV